MNAKLTTVSAVALALASITQAHAQTDVAQPGGEEGYFEKHVVAPTKALELSVGTGYTQGFGNLQAGVSMQDVITPGIAVDLGVGYRIDPHWAIGLVGQYQEFTAERAVSARGLVAGIAAAYHISPYTRTDPFVQLGTGYRMLWENHDASPTLMSHGFELAKLTLGVDIRVDKDVALAPVIGADLTLPLWQSVGGANSVAINDPRLSTFVFAGLQGRFDITSAHESGMPPAQPVAEARITQAPVAAPPPAPPPVVEQVQPVSPSINVSEELLAACNITLSNVEKAPKFEFDKSDLLPQDIAVLDKIIECFTTGPMKDNGLSLVGRADPRGTKKYNDALGMRRANNVSAYLEQHGIVDSRINKISRGERDATGTDEASWAMDRRVDIGLSH